MSQSKYAKNLVKKFGLESSKTAKTPMSTTTKLTKDENGVKVDPTLYRSMIGSLLYLTASCNAPEIRSLKFLFDYVHYVLCACMIYVSV